MAEGPVEIANVAQPIAQAGGAENAGEGQTAVGMLRTPGKRLCMDYSKRGRCRRMERFGSCEFVHIENRLTRRQLREQHEVGIGATESQSSGSRVQRQQRPDNTVNNVPEVKAEDQKRRWNGISVDLHDIGMSRVPA